MPSFCLLGKRRKRSVRERRARRARRLLSLRELIKMKTTKLRRFQTKNSLLPPLAPANGVRHAQQPPHPPQSKAAHDRRGLHYPSFLSKSGWNWPLRLEPQPSGPLKTKYAPPAI